MKTTKEDTEDSIGSTVLLADAYRGKPNGCNQGQVFQKWGRASYQTIEPLVFLHGKKWDDVALAYAHGVRPSIIRVVEADEGTQLDARAWRVTVYLEDDAETIRKIEQEVEVGLPEGVKHGTALQHALEWGIDSKQCKWHLDATGYMHLPDGYYKITKEGSEIFPS